MIRNLLLMSLLFALAFEATAQKSKLFMPLEMQKAYEKGTRSYTGKPGPRYFQNKASYDILADFEPKTGELKGEAAITYQNNSPDTLEVLVVRQLMNLFEKGAERDFNIGSSDLHDGVQIDRIALDGKEIDTDNRQVVQEQGTNMVLRLPEPLYPDGKIKLEIEWQVTLPNEITIRMGKYGADNWFVGYWYPHIAVYDDVSGWDMHPFTGSAEFYYDFNDFNVRIKLPDAYMAWGSGVLQNPEGHYRDAVVERMEKAKETDEVIPITTVEDVDNGNVLKEKQDEYWHFKSENQADFSFAVSKSYIWDGTSVEVDAESKRRVFVSAVYKRNSSDFHQVADIARETLHLFSEKYIGVPFPHPQLTAFNGDGGMEYSMMINDGDARNYKGTVHLTTHEIGHNYFPFYVGTNESYYAFIDEGLISYIPRLAAQDITNGTDALQSVIQSFANQAGSMFETPLMVKSYMIGDYRSYRQHAYIRPANAYHFLHQMLGDDDFYKAISAYTKRWANKHPTPYDLFFTFEDVLDIDLSWYWKPWFFEFGYPDLALLDYRKNDEKWELTIGRKGNLPVPAYVTITYTDGTTKTMKREADIWKEGNKLFIMNIPEGNKVKTIELETDKVPDVSPEDNFKDL